MDLVSGLRSFRNGFFRIWPRCSYLVLLCLPITYDFLAVLRHCLADGLALEIFSAHPLL